MSVMPDSAWERFSREESGHGRRGWETLRVRLPTEDCWSLLRSAEHGVLCTAGPRQRIDAVPICFVVVSGAIATPVDRIKPKETTALGRVRNLDRDATATLLCEHWSLHDWSQLWWVRAHLVRRSGNDLSPTLLEQGEGALRRKYLQYGDTDFAELLLFDVASLAGWSAARSQPDVTDPLM
jgi:hypothetical protein